MIQGHGGNIDAMARKLGCRPEQIIDMSSNINPLGMPPGMVAYLQRYLHRIGVLPDADAGRAARQMASLLEVDPGRMLAGNGTTHFIYTACQALGARKVLIAGPTYADYADACRMQGIEPCYFLAEKERRFEMDADALDQAVGGCDTVFICNPNNPTGALMARDSLLTLGQRHPKTHFIIDESYLPFASNGSHHTLVHAALDNVSVLWSLSKVFGVPGLRAGFLISNTPTIGRFRKYMQPWNLNSMAQVAMDFLGANREAALQFIEKSRAFLAKERALLGQSLTARTPLTPYPSEAPYLLLALPQGIKSGAVCDWMADRRILIRDCNNFHGLSDQFIRMALKHPEANQMAADHLAGFFQQAVTVNT